MYALVNHVMDFGWGWELRKKHHLKKKKKRKKMASHGLKIMSKLKLIMIKIKTIFSLQFGLLYLRKPIK